MAEQDEYRYSTIVTEDHVCRCKGLSNCKNNTSDSISRYHSDSEDSVFTHDESDDESICRRSQTLTSRRKKNSDKSKEVGKKRKRFWTFRIKKRLPVRLRKNKDHGLPESSQVTGTNTCVCTGYRRTEDHVLGAGVVFNVHASRRYVNGIGSSRSSARSWSESSSQGTGCCLPGARIMGAAASPSVPEFDLMQIVPPPAHHSHTEHLNFVSFNPMDYPTEDIDDILIARRARDIELGIEVDSGGRGSPGLRNRSISPTRMGSMTTHAHYQQQRVGQWAAAGRPPAQEPMLLQQGTQTQLIALNTSFQNQCVITSFPPSSSSEDESSLDAPSEYTALSAHTAYVPGRTVHTQVDYVHCLVPDLLQITNCSFYWGVMDRYEAEKLLENRPEGTFLLRDSAQEEFLFSVSFRRYGRSLHARIEQWKHRFSFDSHDPGVFASQNVCGLIEHYKDPSCCMFFEPMLTLPLNRTFPFSLQHLCRAVICSSTTYDGVSFIPLPKSLRQYLKYYHYKQKVRVRKFECSH